VDPSNLGTNNVMNDSQSIATIPHNPLAGFGLSTPSQAPQPLLIASTLSARAKSWAWRASATYVWVVFAALLIGRYDGVRQIPTIAISVLIDCLSRVGFPPTDPSYFATIVKVGWVLIITGFSIVEIIGFALYVLAFPFGVPIMLILGKVIKSQVAQPTTPTVAIQPTSGKSRRRLPLLSIATVGLMAWFLLYADASRKPILLLGTTFAGLLFGVLFYRFFRRVRPIGEEEAALLGRLEVWAFGALEFAGKATPATKGEIGFYRWVVGWVRRVFRRLSLLVRGRRGRDRISIYVLLEYAFSAISLAFAAVVFWALVIRCAIAPQFLSMSDAVELAASHFIPGLSVPKVAPFPPFWTSLGAGATAWLLFVIVLAPAGSVLPARQGAHAKRLARTYAVFRKTSRLSVRFLCWLSHLEK
jgi:hypothetical protein